jgi:5-deoxy-glucuronate isomerase
MSYFESVPSQAGLNRVSANPFKLLDFNCLILGDGETFSGTTGDREFLAVLLGGRGAFVVDGQTFAHIGGRPNVAANFSRNYHQILTQVGQPDLPAARLIVGETYTPSGNWSTYPPHRHEKDDLPREAYHEELYFFKVSPADGFGLTRYYNDEIDTGYVVRDNTILMAPKGYHTVVSAPGYTTYYLWALAGNHRVQATADDPALSWVGRTVPMLHALGH